MFKFALKITLIVALLTNSAALNYLPSIALAKGPTLRPMASAHFGKTEACYLEALSSEGLPEVDKVKSSSAGGRKERFEIESRFIETALESYPLSFWAEFFRERRDSISGSAAVKISRLAKSSRDASGKGERLSVTFPIRDPGEERYSLNALMKIKDEYAASPQRLNLIGRLELYWLQRICNYKMVWASGFKKKLPIRPRLELTGALRFAFTEQWRDVVKFLITSSGKVIFYAEDSPYRVYVDVGGNYFRIGDTRIRRREHSDRPWIFENDGVVSKHNGPFLEYDDGFRPHRTRTPEEISVFAERFSLTGKMPQRRLIYTHYIKSTHFTIIERAEQFPILPLFISGNSPLKASFTLGETLEKLKSRLGIKDVQVCFRHHMLEDGDISEIKKDGWCFEISNDTKSARLIFAIAPFSFVQHFYQRRQNSPGMASKEAESKSSSAGNAKIDGWVETDEAALPEDLLLEITWSTIKERNQAIEDLRTMGDEGSARAAYYYHLLTDNPEAAAGVSASDDEKIDFALRVLSIKDDRSDSRFWRGLYRGLRLNAIRSMVFVENPDMEKLLPHLMAAMDDTDNRIRVGATIAIRQLAPKLGQLAELAVPVLEKALFDPRRYASSGEYEGHISVEAAITLRLIGAPYALPTLPTLRKALSREMSYRWHFQEIVRETIESLSEAKAASRQETFVGKILHIEFKSLSSIERSA